MLNIVTNSELHYNEGEECVDMCEAIEGIKNDAKAEGIKEGMEKVIEQMRKSGMSEEQIKQVLNS